MLTEESSMEIRVLHKQGLSLRQICQQTGYSINTVRKYVGGEKPGYRQRQNTQPTKLSAYEAYIRERLLAVTPEWIPAPVIYREIKALGYEGKIRQLRYFMQTLKPLTTVEPLVRFETQPGEQVQIDWAHFHYQDTKLYAFVAIVGYSRLAFVRFMGTMDIDSLLRCHEALFDYLNGVPQHCLYDNMKTVVIARNAYGPGQHRLHPTLQDFAKHYGFMPRLCKPYRAKTKGKVERFIRYLRHSFFIPLIGRLHSARLPLDKDTANLEVRYWLDEVANCREHATTLKIPAEEFVKEQPRLQALPRHPYFPLNVPTVVMDNQLSTWPIEHLQHELSVYDQLY